MDDETLLARFPGHAIDQDNAAHYRGRLEHRLLLNRCRACDTWHHPPRPICRRCWSRDVQPSAVAGAGTVHLVVWLHQGPTAEGVDYTTPYPVVTVELDEQAGLRFTSTLVGGAPLAIEIGDRVELCWIDRAGVPLPVFRRTKELRVGGREGQQ